MWLPPTIKPRNFLKLEPGTWFFDRTSGQSVLCLKVIWEIEPPEYGYFSFVPGDAPIVDHGGNDFPTLSIGADLYIELDASGAVDVGDYAALHKAGGMFLTGNQIYVTGSRRENDSFVAADTSSGRVAMDAEFEKPRATFKRWRVWPVSDQGTRLRADGIIEPLLTWPMEKSDK